MADNIINRMNDAIVAKKAAMSELRLLAAELAQNSAMLLVHGGLSDPWPFTVQRPEGVAEAKQFLDSARTKAKHLDKIIRMALEQYTFWLIDDILTLDDLDQPVLIACPPDNMIHGLLNLCGVRTQHVYMMVALLREGTFLPLVGTIENGHVQPCRQMFEHHKFLADNAHLAVRG